MHYKTSDVTLGELPGDEARAIRPKHTQKGESVHKRWIVKFECIMSCDEHMPWKFLRHAGGGGQWSADIDVVHYWIACICLSSMLANLLKTEALAAVPRKG